MISVKNVNYHLKTGTQILHDVSLELGTGQVIALIGPNGAGKSTLFSVMARVNPLQSGTVSFGGHDIGTTDSRTLARTVAMLTQENHVQGRLRVHELLMFGRYPYHQGRPTAEDKQIVEDALLEFQLTDFAERYITELSGGQRQRALIAMVFCQRTDYVLLDEPLNNLDMYHARSLMQLLQRLTYEHQRTTVVVLHDINQAAAYADHVVAMQNGRVLMEGHPNDIFTVANIRHLFDMDVTVLEHAGRKLVVHHV